MTTMKSKKARASRTLHGPVRDRALAEEQLPPPSRALRNARMAQGLSLRALSARAGLPYSTLSKLENGKMALTYDKIVRLAQALNVDIKDIVAAEQPLAPVAAGRRSVT